MSLCNLMIYKFFQKRQQLVQTRTIGNKIFMQSNNSYFQIDKEDSNVKLSFSDDSVIYNDKKQKIELRMSIEQSLPIESDKDEVIEVFFNPRGLSMYE